MLSRRSFLEGVGATAAGVALTGCSKRSSPSASSSAGPNLTTTTALRAAGDRPDPSKPAGTDTLPQIEHIVVLMMEDHSYDNYFGMLERGDGFTLGPDGKPTNANDTANGQSVRAFHMANTCALQDQPRQTWNDSHQQFADGALTGFVQSGSGAVAMGYFNADDIPFYYGLANTFPLCDRWFGSCLARTFPNRRFLLAGTSQGTVDNDLDFVFNGPPPAAGTIMDQLNRHDIAWRDYASSLPTVGLFRSVFDTNQDKIATIDQFFTDAAAGRLPAFSIVDPDPNTGTTEENPADITLGESFASKIIQATMRGPGWDKTVLIWCYDEHGGYYDHVPPPAAVPPDDIAPMTNPGDRPGDFARYGFRVPAVIVSPYAKRDYVSHVVHDHTSILKLVERKFNLPALTNRDANADDLLDSLDFDNPAFLTPPALPAPRNVDGSTPLCTTPGPIPNPAG